MVRVENGARNRLPAWLKVVSAVVLVVIVVSFAVMKTTGTTVADLRRELRGSLGLPKRWKTGFNENTAAYDKLRCPARDAIVIVTGGQSNASNAYENASKADSDNPQTFMFFGGSCYRLRSPVLGTTGDGDSLWPRLGDAINAATRRPVVFIDGAVGGVQLNDWLDDRSGYLGRLARQIRLARAIGFKPDMVLWIQGETDSSTMIEPALYVSQQQDLIAKLDKTSGTDASLPWVVYRSTRCKHRRNNGPEIDKAITAYAAKPGDRVIAGPLVSAFDDSFRRDACHLNRRGRDRLVGETMAVLRSAGLLPSAM